MKTLVTGGAGFIGTHVVRQLMAQNAGSVVVGSRYPRLGEAESLTIGELDHMQIGPADLEPFEGIVHTAAISAVTSQQDLQRLNAVNVAGTLNLARYAADAGVKRFVFLSSAKVGGETTAPGRALKEDDTPAPLQPYAKSKLEAERGLEKIAETTDMAVTILRPPLVHGAGVHGNFLTLAKAVSQRLPLPLGHAKNLRSLIGARNLADAIGTALLHPNAANQRFYVADSPDLSTSELFAHLGRALGSPPRLFNFPPPLLKILAGLVGKDGIYERLFVSFQVDSSLIRKQLGWNPRYSIEQEFSEFANQFESPKQSIGQAL